MSTASDHSKPEADSNGHEAPRGEIGKPRRRVEDRPLVLGEGRYVDDLRPPGLLHVALVRSAYAAARVASIDASAAAALPGVVSVATADDPDLRDVPDLAVNPFVPGIKSVPHGPLVKGWVRTVGEPVAAVVAESRYLAADAAEQVAVEFEPLSRSPRLRRPWRPVRRWSSGPAASKTTSPSATCSRAATLRWAQSSP